MGSVMFEGSGFLVDLVLTNDVEQSSKITIKPNEWHDVEFNVQYDMTIRAVDGFEIISSVYEGAFGDLDMFEVSFDRLTATLKHYRFYNDPYVFVTKTEGSTPPIEVAGFNHLYLVDMNILGEISTHRFITNDAKEIDLGNYILNILELPMQLSNESLGVERDVVLGNHTIPIKAVELVEDEMIIDFGEILVPHKFNNSYDFINTDVNLHLPFSQTIKLDVNYVINHKIGVIYKVDLYSGSTTINISSSLVGSVIRSENTKIGRNIPFISKSKQDVSGSITDNAGIDNGLKKPFIEVVRNILYDKNNPFNTSVKKRGLLSDVVGLVEIENILLKSNATVSEKQRIVSLLESGVEIR